MKHVEHWDDERASGNGIIVTLVPGRSFCGTDHAGVRGFDTPTEAREAVRDSVPCPLGPDCPDCEATP